MITLDLLWDDEPTKTPAKEPEHVSVPRLAITTDIKQWLASNAPASDKDLKDIRLALYQGRCCGHYAIEPYGKYGDQLLLTGPLGSLLIVSNKARHFLLRSLCAHRRRYGLQGF